MFLFSILCRGTSLSFNELVYEVINVFVAHFFCDRVDLIIGLFKKKSRFIESLPVEIILKRASILFPEKLSQVCAVYIILLAKSLQSKIAGIIIFYLLLNIG